MGSFPPSSRIHELEPEELEVYRQLEPERLPQTVGRCFGIQRLSEDSRAIIEEALSTMIAEKQVAISGRYAVAVE